MPLTTYQGLYGQTGANTAVPQNPVMQPSAPASPTKPGQPLPTAVPATPSPSQQVQSMTGGSRQSRGYGNTPLSQNAGQPGQPGRPPVGTKKIANAVMGYGGQTPSVGGPSSLRLGSTSMPSPTNNNSSMMMPIKPIGMSSIPKIACELGRMLGALAAKR